jgi:hypothetical protein
MRLKTLRPLHIAVAVEQAQEDIVARFRANLQAEAVLLKAH